MYKKIVSISFSFLWLFPLSALAVDKAFLKQVLDASDIYNMPYEDDVHPKEARREASREINNLKYDVVRYNHGLAHGVRQAYLVARIVDELRDNKANKSELAKWLQDQDKDFIGPFVDKVKLLALYYRIGRQNEYSPSGGTDEEKARFDENMHEGAKLFAKAAKEAGLFKDAGEINTYVEPFFHYEYHRQNKEFSGIAVYIDQLLYAAHILDLRRVTAGWNLPPEGPKAMLPMISEILGFGSEVDPVVHKLNDYAGKLLNATGDRDAWDNKKTLSDDFFYEAYAPEFMLMKVDAVK